MAGDSPILDSLKREWAEGEHAVEHWAGNLFQRQHDTPAQGADPYPQPPAQMPATMAAATAAAATPQEEDMSLATLGSDLGQRIANAEHAVHDAVQAEVGKLVADLPALTAEAAKFAGTPLGKLAITGAQHVAAGVIPPEALAIVESGAVDLYNKLFAIYNPQGAVTDPAPTGQQPVQAPAQQ